MPARPSLRPYYRHLKPVWPRFVAGILFGVLYSVASGFGLPTMAKYVFPILFGERDEAPRWLVDLAVTFFGDDPTNGLLIVCCLGLPFMMGIRAVSAVGNGYFMTYTGVHVVQSIQISVFKKLQELPVRFFQGKTTGELMACLMGYPTQIKQGVVDVSNDLIKQPLTLISACAFLIIQSIQSESFFAALIGLLSVPPLVLIVRRIGKYLAKRSRQLVKLGEQLNSSAIESIQAFLVIRAFNLESKMTQRFIGKLREAFVVTMKSVRGNLMISPSVEFIAALGLSAALYLGVRNGMDQGEFIALATALYMAYSPLKRLGSIHGILKAMEGAIERLDEVLNASSSVPVATDPVKLPRPVSGRISLHNVSFSYVEDQPALRDVTLEIEPGQTVALVGPSGAGKSTFVNLIPRFMDPTSGSIELDGIDLRKLRPEDLREEIAYVPQESLLFNAPVKENLRVGRQDASDEAVIEAARRANAHEFIVGLENGYDTVLAERGASLSGGQRQRISIARAFLRDAPVLLLDEATASLDSDSEFQIQEEMVNLAKGRTTLIIAHRFSTIRIADRILVFDQGRIVGDGTFEELSRSHDLFRSLLEKQQG